MQFHNAYTNRKFLLDQFTVKMASIESNYYHIYNYGKNNTNPEYKIAIHLYVPAAIKQ